MGGGPTYLARTGERPGISATAPLGRRPEALEGGKPESRAPQVEVTGVLAEVSSLRARSGQV